MKNETIVLRQRLSLALADTLNFTPWCSYRVEFLVTIYPLLIFAIKMISVADQNFDAALYYYGSLFLGIWDDRRMPPSSLSSR